MPTKYLSLRCFEETHHNLKLLAAMLGKSMSATLHELVSEALAAEQEKRES